MHIDGAITPVGGFTYFDPQVRFLAADASWGWIRCTPDAFAHVLRYARDLSPWDSWDRQNVWR